MLVDLSSAQTWRSPATLLITLIIAQIIYSGAGWAQENSPATIGEGIATQEKIYKSQGADVPSGYVTSRALSDYVALLPSSFCSALTNLGISDRWLDIGAGSGYAILDYFQMTKCARPDVKARVVALSIEDRRTDAWKKHADNLGEDRLRYLAGKRLRHYTTEELGKFHMITDVYGGFSYTEDLSQFVEKVLGLLEPDGLFYMIVQGVRLEDGKDPPDTAYQTELVDPAGKDVKVCSWLKQISCVKVACQSNSEWTPTEQIQIRKLCSDVSVPRLKLSKYEAGNPPGRRFQLER